MSIQTSARIQEPDKEAEGLQLTLVERLTAVTTSLPPQAQAELLDFAEFLYLKNSQAMDSGSLPLLSLAGGLEASKTFVGSPMSIQEALRSEWD